MLLRSSSTPSIPTSWLPNPPQSQPTTVAIISPSKTEKKVEKLVQQSLVMGDGMGSDDGGKKICNGWESSSNNHDDTDAYYHNIIQANPNNPLLLSNYAKFLKEVRGNYPKAEEYAERAILANPIDAADALSLYADLIWQTEKNADRAEDYFHRAVQSNPDDCYVLASYAKFLWDIEEEEDDKTENGPPASCYSSLSI